MVSCNGVMNVVTVQLVRFYQLKEILVSKAGYRILVLVLNGLESDAIKGFHDLSGRNLSGTVPKGMSQITELRSISLQNNNLSGTLPDLCSLTKLEIIRLENNYLTGIIPDCLSQLSNLKQLYVSYFAAISC
ncbi:probable LRR receptor-like serine/threonine-protein kinase At2g23950 [Cryptomeria japonica]|uniref:probable LRR receptor-like serine/threonine-protein kinase At2g23950 n=1 Tax=Cryptomeria japonica TaxID=3369 RepID=UPI0027DA65FA|nr:probable LRR receptor-like serine/threonine-protein kinase At2g23950 [Cryptomeria japonica]